MGDGVDLTKKVITAVVFLGVVVVYVVLYYSFLRDIVDAPSGQAPNLDNGDVQLATGIGGLLGGVFAVAFGIQRQDPTKNEKKLKIGATLTPRAQWVTIVCLVAYALVGAATLIVARTHGAESPQEIQASATVFAGYVASIFAAVITGPGKTQ
jgi:hypothetical protein